MSPSPCEASSELSPPEMRALQLISQSKDPVMFSLGEFVKGLKKSKLIEREHIVVAGKRTAVWKLTELGSSILASDRQG